MLSVLFSAFAPELTGEKKDGLSEFGTHGIVLGVSSVLCMLEHWNSIQCNPTRAGAWRRRTELGTY